MTDISNKLKAAGAFTTQRNRATPLWKGPEEDGVTFSMLSKFLQCRERFRLYVVEGLRPRDTFNHKIEYGLAWHVCEEAHAAGNNWDKSLLAYCQLLARKYPTQQEQVQHWYNVCRIQFPVYTEYWAKHPDITNRTPLLQEKVFSVPYKLPSGRMVKLRGKWDSVDLISEGKCNCGADRSGPSAEAHRRDCPANIQEGIWLQENKTKGTVVESQLVRQLSFDLQTMTYLVALGEYQVSKGQYRLGGDGIPRGTPIRGVRYNVIRRPLSGGEGTIFRHKATKGSKCPKCKGLGFLGTDSNRVTCSKCRAGRIGGKSEESKEAYYARLATVIKESQDTYFYRWNVTITQGDIDRFKVQCLNPILESMVDWWNHIRSTSEQAFQMNYSNGSGHHWRHPFGCENFIDLGGVTDLDDYLATGSTVGLTQVNSLFPELE